jgi:ectoine hydroxylase-related dioxygenase (phytanoyl-CoA dioxygenase family)
MWQQILNTRGFAILPNVFTRIEMEDFLSSLNQVSLKRSRAGVRHALSVSAVASLARNIGLLKIAGQVVGPGCLPFRATLFEKTGRANWLVAWHQDTALPLREWREAQGWGPWSVKDGVIYAHAPAGALSLVLAIRVHLDDSMEHNGPLRVVPGTHSRGVLTDEEIHELAANQPVEECLVPCGGILAMRPLLVHSSSMTRNQDPRRILHIEYAPSLALEDGLELAIS